jgi:nucleoside permease NupC
MYIGRTFYLTEAQGTKMGIILVVMWIAGVIGWIANLIQTLYMLTSLERIIDISGFGIVQVIGIFFAPVGSILGWYGMF